MQPADLSLYFHFPFCDTLCYFCGCTMLVTRDRQRIEEYNGYLKRKRSTLVAALIAPGRRVVQVHWGGGTPTHLFPGPDPGYRRLYPVVVPGRP